MVDSGSAARLILINRCSHFHRPVSAHISPRARKSSLPVLGHGMVYPKKAAGDRLPARHGIESLPGRTGCTGRPTHHTTQQNKCQMRPGSTAQAFARDDGCLRRRVRVKGRLTTRGQFQAVQDCLRLIGLKLLIFVDRADAPQEPTSMSPCAKRSAAPSGQRRRPAQRRTR